MKKKIKFISIFLFFLIFLLNLTNTNIKNVDIGFSPGNSANEIVLKAIQEAKTSIDIAAYSFTNKFIVAALLRAKNRGVNIRFLADKKTNYNKSYIINLKNHNIPVRLNDKYLIMHNKFMIIDGISVETGSFNYTNNAVHRNAENVIYLRNKPNIAKKYTKEFNRLWEESKTIIKTIY